MPFFYIVILDQPILCDFPDWGLSRSLVYVASYIRHLSSRARLLKQLLSKHLGMRLNGQSNAVGKLDWRASRWTWDLEHWEFSILRFLKIA